MSLELALVIPCFNEAGRLQTAPFHAFAATHPGVSFCFVNDGSADATPEILRELAAELGLRATFLDLAENHGKAEAVRAAIQHLLKSDCPPWLGYWDADLATPLDEVTRFLEYLHTHPHIRFLLGSRHLRLGVNIRRSTRRHYLGRIFATAASWILGLPVYDTQCGAKLIHRELAAGIFAEPFHSRWFYDVELLARVVAAHGRERTLELVHELPLQTWVDPGGSHLKARDFVRTPLDLLAIRRHYRQALRREPHASTSGR